MSGDALNAVIERTHKNKETSTLQLFLAWTFVGVPLLASVLQTLPNAMQMFLLDHQR